MSKKIKISSEPKQLTINELQSLARELKIEDWQDKSRGEILLAIDKIAAYDPKKAKIENILNSAPGGIGGLGQLWYMLFEKNKFWTTSLTLILAIASVITSIYFDSNKLTNEKKIDLENSIITTQIENLKEVESSLENLIQFVQYQKSTLTQTELKIESLLKEKKQIEPIVLANREVIQAIFQQQAENSKVNAWKERTIGFGLGILGSFLASILIYLLTRKNKQLKIIT
jgi:hypothetical protein